MANRHIMRSISSFCITIFFFLGLLSATPLLAQVHKPYSLAKGVDIGITADRHNSLSHVPIKGSLVPMSSDSNNTGLIGISSFNKFQIDVYRYANLNLETSSENRTGELIGMLIGGISGGVISYVAAVSLSNDPLAKVAVVPGSFIGILIGGIIGANVGSKSKGALHHRSNIGSLSIPIGLD